MHVDEQDIETELRTLLARTAGTVRGGGVRREAIVREVARRRRVRWTIRAGLAGAAVAAAAAAVLALPRGDQRPDTIIDPASEPSSSDVPADTTSTVPAGSTPRPDGSATSTTQAPARPDFPPEATGLHQGSQVWAVYLAVAPAGAYDSPELLAADAAAAEAGYPAGQGYSNLACDNGAPDALPRLSGEPTWWPPSTSWIGCWRPSPAPAPAADRPAHPGRRAPRPAVTAGHRSSPPPRPARPWTVISWSTHPDRPPFRDACRVEIHPVTPDRLDDLADLFGSNATTRGCWCMWFIGPAQEVRAGWRDAGNRRAFEARARSADPPLGLLAYDGATPVGWLATGPRSRYPRAIGPRGRILKGRDPSEDDDVWLLPCFFVRVGYRRTGVTTALLAAAVEQATAHGAAAVEGFPIADGQPRSTDDYLGKQQRFAECGFSCVAAPSPRRVVMRRDLT